MKTDIKSLFGLVDKLVSWKVYALSLILLAGFVGWIASDHIGLSKTVSHAQGYLQIVAENQAEMMKSMGLSPKHVK